MKATKQHSNIATFAFFIYSNVTTEFILYYILYILIYIIYNIKLLHTYFLPFYQHMISLMLLCCYVAMLLCCYVEEGIS